MTPHGLPCPGPLSRRGFLTGTGTAAAAVTGLTAELAPSALGHQPAAVPALGPAPVMVQLTVICRNCWLSCDQD